MGPGKPKNQMTSLPWSLTTEGISRFMRDWKNAQSLEEFRDKHNLDKKQLAKCQDIVKKLLKQGIKIKVMRTSWAWTAGLDWNKLKQVAADLER